MQKLNINEWSRGDHFRFFRQFEEPFFGVSVIIDCTTAYHTAKEKGVSFFLWYLHKSLTAVNCIEPFRYRIQGEDVVVYDDVSASPTINRPDGTFGFAYMNYYDDFEQFSAEATKEIERVQSSKGLVPAVSGEGVIHYSSLPWISFTSVAHARAFSFKDSIPKITFGKMTEQNGVLSMPMSVHVHHALMDGYDVGKYIDLFQLLMKEEYL